jgi:hypothetical protein
MRREAYKYSLTNRIKSNTEEQGITLDSQRIKKPQFTYCKLEDLQQLETLLKSLGFQFPAQTKNLGHNGQNYKAVQHTSGHKDSSLISKIKGAGSSVRIEHHPPKVGVVGSNPTPPAPFSEIGLISNTFKLFATS